MRNLGFPAEYYDMTTEIALRCRVDQEVFSPDTGEERFDPEDTVVFSSKEVIIDAYQAIKDVTGAWKIRDLGLQKIIESLSRGLDIVQALRESPPLAEWLDDNPRVREAAEKLSGTPRRTQPDFSTVVDLPFDRIREVIPVRRARGEIMAAYPPGVLKELGVPLRSVDSLSGKAPGFSAWVKELILMDEARGKYEDGDYASAALLLEGIIKANPDDLEARFFLAEALYFLKRYERAIAQYEFLEENNYNPWRMPRLLTRKGWAYSWLKRSEEARESFESAIVLKDDYAPPRYALGILDYRQGRYRGAIESLKIFLSLRSEGKQADKARGLIRRMGG